MSRSGAVVSARLILPKSMPKRDGGPPVLAFLPFNLFSFPALVPALVVVRRPGEAGA